MLSWCHTSSLALLKTWSTLNPDPTNDVGARLFFVWMCSDFSDMIQLLKTKFLMTYMKSKIINAYILSCFPTLSFQPQPLTLPVHSHQLIGALTHSHSWPSWPPKYDQLEPQVTWSHGRVMNSCHDFCHTRWKCIYMYGDLDPPRWVTKSIKPK